MHFAEEDEEDCVEADTKPESPLPNCEKEESGERRRRALNEAVVADVDEAWHEQWRQNFSCWWIGLPMPTQSQFGACMGALGLTLGSRLDAAWRAAQTALGRPPTPLAPSSLAAEPGCEGLFEGKSQLALPSFPDFPADLKFMPPPIPRLMPTWERMTSLVDQQSAAHATASAQPAQLAPHESSNQLILGAGAGAGAGVALGSLFVLAVGCGRKQRAVARVEVVRRGSI